MIDMISWKEEKETLNQYINKENLSYEEIGRRYGCTGAAVKKAAKRLNITLPQRRSINKNETFGKGTAEIAVCRYCNTEFIPYIKKNKLFCSSECLKKYKHAKDYQRILLGESTIMRANYSPRNFKQDIIKEQNNICAICGCPQEHNGKPLVFILDHIDGNAANNKRTNLRCICPNCDSQLETYKSKNKDSARHYYRYKKG